MPNALPVALPAANERDNMNVQELIPLLETRGDASLRFVLPSGEFIPDHFHVT